jgi:hypothetical protein
MILTMSVFKRIKQIYSLFEQRVQATEAIVLNRGRQAAHYNTKVD